MGLDTSLPCSQQSLAIGEPIAGTATAEVRAWICVEYRERWEPDVADVPLPAALRARIAAAARHRPRLQLIRRWHADGPLQAFVVRTEPSPRIWRFRFEDHAALGAIDLDALLASNAPLGEPDPPDTLQLVCTHGRRDRCCALRGVAFFKSLHDLGPRGELWQTSHLGGHRFAATMVHLPRGICYGRLTPEDAEAMLAAHTAGHLYDLRRYRGQTRYPAPVQAAESWLREQEGDMSLEGPRLIAHGPEGHRYQATFERHLKRHRLVLEPRRSAALRKTSCDAADLTPVTWHYVVRHETEMI